MKTPPKESVLFGIMIVGAVVGIIWAVGKIIDTNKVIKESKKAMS